MKTPCNEIEARLDRYLETDLPAQERLEIAQHLQGCPECHALAQSDAELARELSGLPKVTCPDCVIERIETATIRRPTRRRSSERLRLPVPTGRWLPLAPAVLGAAIVALLLLARPFEQKLESGPTAVEIRLAEKQTRWAISFVLQKVDRGGRQKTGEIVRNDIPMAIRNCLSRVIPDPKGE